MRIHFATSTRPERIAKALRKFLKTAGFDFRLSLVREAVAVMYGYRNWNDLLANIGRLPPSPYDDALSDADRTLRRRDFADRLADRLGLPDAVANDAVDAVGPMSRSLVQPVAPRSISDCIRAAAAHVTERASSIDPVSFRSGELRGFRIVSKPLSQLRATQAGDSSATRDRNDWLDKRVMTMGLVVSPDGARMAMVHAGGELPDDATDSSSDDLGLLCGGHILSFGTEAKTEPHPVILETFSRLQPKALERLAFLPEISPKAYAIAASLAETSPLARLVDSLPMLASEIRHIARGQNGSGSLMNRMRMRMLGSENPMAVYVESVSDFVRHTWPQLAPDARRIERTARWIGDKSVLHDLGLQTWHTAFLSFGPDDALPRDGGQMGAAMHFIERWTKLFNPNIVGMDPSDFYAEFRVRFGNDWERVDTYSASRMKGLFHVREDLATAVLAAAALETGEFEDLEDYRAVETLDSSGPVGTFIAQHAFPGRGMAELYELVENWEEEHYPGGVIDKDPERMKGQVRGQYEGLFRHGLLPRELVGHSAVEILEMAGVDPERFLDPEYEPASAPLA